MRWTRLVLIVCALASMGASGDRRAPSQPPPPSQSQCASWRDDTTARWSGRWTDAQGWVYTFDLSLRRHGAIVSGQYLWRLVTSADATMSNRVGDRAIERVRGTIDCAANTMEYAGYEITDDTLIAADAYRVALGAGLSLTGRTRGNEGAWDGSFTARRR
ncbi:MAG: hypothetical protein JNK05_41820 [Myxococcales bacterium]|nr:hypothetical protein [Myxococcales bacterium]